MIIGISGNMGSGKSTVGKYLRELGYLVIDSDALTFELYQQGTSCYEQLVATFGKDILDEQLAIERSKLSAMVFNDISKKAQLEQIVHQEILKELYRRSSQQNSRLIFWEVPLLFEVGWESKVDCVLYISSDRATLLERVKQRDNLSEEQIQARLAHQENAISKLTSKDFLIMNDGSLETLKAKIDAVLIQLNQCN